MTDAERIAKWLRVDLVECPLDYNDTTRYEIGRWAHTNGYANGCFLIARDSEDPQDPLIAVVDDSDDDLCRRWNPKYDITLWHGNDGILAEIKKRGFGEFYYWLWVEEDRGKTLTSILDGIDIGVNATPAQLTAALVKTIKESKNSVWR